PRWRYRHRDWDWRVSEAAALSPPARGREGRALESRRQPIANCTAPALIFSHVLTKRLVADDGTMKSGIGFAPALFVCRPFVYFTPAQKGGCSNANSSNFDHYHRCLRGDSGAQTPLQIRFDPDQLRVGEIGGWRSRRRRNIEAGSGARDACTGNPAGRTCTGDTSGAAIRFPQVANARNP